MNRRRAIKGGVRRTWTGGVYHRLVLVGGVGVGVGVVDGMVA